jgi:hypothetical protein
MSNNYPVSRIFCNGRLISVGVSSSAGTESDDDLATKEYVDGSVFGIKWKNSVKAATTTEIILSGTQTVDDVILGINDRILVKNQLADDSKNGIYLVKSGAWVRSSDADSSDELVSACVMIEEGTVNAELKFVCTNDSGFILDTDTVTWTQFSCCISHNSMNGIQGGTTDQYYHMTSAEYTELSAWVASATLSADGSINTSSGTITTPSVTYGANPIIRASGNYLYCEGNSRLYLRPTKNSNHGQCQLTTASFDYFSIGGSQFIKFDGVNSSLNVDNIVGYSDEDEIEICALVINDGEIKMDTLVVQNDGTGSTKLEIKASTSGSSEIDLESYGSSNASRINFIHGGSQRYYFGVTEATEKLVIYNNALTANSFELTTAGAVYFAHAKDDAIGDAAAFWNSTTGQLGITSSILESKTQINTITDASWIYKLDPKTFKYRKTIDKFKWDETEYIDTLRYGLIAEDVEKINPNICIYSNIKNHTTGCEYEHKNMSYDCKCKCPERKKLINYRFQDLISPTIKCLKDHQTKLKNINEITCSINPKTSVQIPIINIPSNGTHMIIQVNLLSRVDYDYIVYEKVYMINKKMCKFLHKTYDLFKGLSLITSDLYVRSGKLFIPMENNSTSTTHLSVSYRITNSV